MDCVNDPAFQASLCPYPWTVPFHIDSRLRHIWLAFAKGIMTHLPQQRLQRALVYFLLPWTSANVIKNMPILACWGRWRKTSCFDRGRPRWAGPADLPAAYMHGKPSPGQHSWLGKKSFKSPSFGMFCYSATALWWTYLKIFSAPNRLHNEAKTP